jgi:hypothetical protein
MSASTQSLPGDGGGGSSTYEEDNAGPAFVAGSEGTVFAGIRKLCGVLRRWSLTFALPLQEPRRVGFILLSPAPSFVLVHGDHKPWSEVPHEHRKSVFGACNEYR